MLSAHNQSSSFLSRHTNFLSSHTHTHSHQLNRAKAVEKEKLDLEGAKDEAEQYLEMQKDVAKRQHALYQRYMSVKPLLPCQLHCRPKSLRFQNFTCGCTTAAHHTKLKGRRRSFLLWQNKFRFSF